MLSINSVKALMERHLEGWILKAARVISYFVLVACILFLARSYFLLGDRLGYCNWADRDMVRTAQMFKEFQVSGAELSFGGGARIPGGFLHYVWGLPMLFSDNPVTVHRFMLAINLLGAIVLILLVKRYFNLYAGLAAAILFLSSRATVAVTHKLWNPGFIGLFCICFTYCMYKVIIDRRHGFFKWALASLCIGVQMHFSVVLLLVPAILLLFVYRTFPPRREWLKAVGLVVLLLSPYIIVEFCNGFQNTRLLLTQPQLGQGSRSLLHLSPAWGNISSMAKSHFAPETFPRMGVGIYYIIFSFLEPVLRYLILVIGVAYALSLMTIRLLGGNTEAALCISDRQRKGLVISLVVFFVSILYYVLDPNIRLWAGDDSRFIFFLVPVFSICLGGAAGCFLEGLYSRRKHLLSLFMVAIVTLGLVHHTFGTVRYLARLNTQQTIYSWGGLANVIRIIQNRTNWSLEEVIGKTVILQYQGENKWTWQAGWSSAYLLHQVGAEFPGSGFPPGGILLQDGKIRLGNDKRVSKDFLIKYLPPEFANIEIRRQFSIGPHIFVEYDRPSGRCLTGFSVRQILTKPEKVAFQNYGKLSRGEVMAYEDGDPASRTYLVSLGFNVLLNVIIRGDGNALDVELHSNQLRGYAWNVGFYDWAAVRNLNVVFRSVGSGRETRVPASRGIIGGHGPYRGGVHTPLRIGDLLLPQGTYDVIIEGELVSNKKIWTSLNHHNGDGIDFKVATGNDVYHDTIVLSGNKGTMGSLSTGTEVVLTADHGALPKPLEPFKTYYLIKVSDSMFKISDSLANATQNPPKVIDIINQGHGRISAYLSFSIPLDRIHVGETVP